MHSVGHDQRSGVRVEPLVSLQWFCRMDELAAPAIAAVREGRVRFHPKGAERIFFSWMDQIRPWCVSRQLWWGHQIPVWYCENDHVIVQESDARALPRVRHPRARARPRRAGHVVLVGPVAVRDARLARRDGRPAHVLSRPRAVDRPRDHQPLGRSHADDGDRVPRRDPVQRRRRPLRRAGAGRAPHVEVARDRNRSRRADRALRRRRDALRAAQDELDAGRAVRRGHDRRGSRPDEQAVERRPPDPDERGRRRARADRRRIRRRVGADTSRSRDRRGVGADRCVRPRGGRQGALPVRLERRLRLVPRGVQGAPLLRRSGRAGAGLGDVAIRPRSHACACATRCCRS